MLSCLTVLSIARASCNLTIGDMIRQVHKSSRDYINSISQKAVFKCMSNGRPYNNVKSIYFFSSLGLDYTVTQKLKLWKTEVVINILIYPCQIYYMLINAD